MSSLARVEHVQEISVTPDRSAVVLRILKELTFSNAPLFDGIFHEYLKRGARSILLDLSGIGFVDSGGVGSLVKLRKALQACGGELALLNPGRTIQNILRIVGLAPLVRHEPLDGQPGAAGIAGAVAPSSPAASGGGVLDGLSLRGEADGVADDEVDMHVDRLLMETAAAPEAAAPGRQISLVLRESITSLNAGVLLDGLLAYLKQGVTSVRVDVRAVEFIDSTGVGMLVRVSLAYQGSGARLVLCSPGPSLKRILEIVKLDRVLPIES